MGKNAKPKSPKPSIARYKNEGHERKNKEKKQAKHEKRLAYFAKRKIIKDALKAEAKAKAIVDNAKVESETKGVDKIKPEKE